MDEIERFRQLRKEIQENSDLPNEKDVIVQLLNTLVRGNELVYRFDEYYRAGYHLGYFLIQSQRIENTVAGAIDSAETLRARKSMIEKNDLRLNTKPLGALIDLLQKYIEGDSVFVPLREFNRYRITIVHRLSEDFSRSLTEIEQSVARDYPPEKINEIQNILIEVTARIGQKVFDLMEDELIAKKAGNKLGNDLLELVALPDLEFTIIENPSI